MRRSWLLVPAAAAVFLAFRAAPDAPKIAVVDMSRLLRENKRSRDDQTGLQQWKTEADQGFGEKRKRYDADVAELETLKPDTDEYRRRVLDLKTRKFQLEQEDAAIKDEGKRKIGRSLIEAHARVTAACKKYADDHDLDVVLQYSSAPVEGARSDDVVPEIVVRTVVTFRRGVDATDAVLALMDAVQ